MSVEGKLFLKSSVQRPLTGSPSYVVTPFDRVALRLYCAAKNRMLEAGPALFVDGLEET